MLIMGYHWATPSSDGEIMDLVIRDARILARGELRTVDIGIQGSTIAVISQAVTADALELKAAGCLVVPGLIETHIHLDKTCILNRCRIEEGTVAEAVRETAAAKRDFTVEDIYARGSRTLERCIAQGTMRMRSHVELDPGIGMIGFEAIEQLARLVGLAETMCGTTRACARDYNLPSLRDLKFSEQETHG